MIQTITLGFITVILISWPIRVKHLKEVTRNELFVVLNCDASLTVGTVHGQMKVVAVCVAA
jgi:hypothetical protein